MFHSTEEFLELAHEEFPDTEEGLKQSRFRWRALGQWNPEVWIAV